MSRRDDQRWSDWRRDGMRPLKPTRKCTECFTAFRPLASAQTMCVKCIGNAEVVQRAIEREANQVEIDALIANAEIEVVKRQAEARMDSAARAAHPHPNVKRERKRLAAAPGKPSTAAKSRRTCKAKWAPVAVRKKRDGWTVRKIAKYLGRSPGEIAEVLKEAGL